MEFTLALEFTFSSQQKQSCYDQFYEIVVLMEIYERNALHEW